MRVKKFEAKTMKDALQMVKAELGPDAVILGAKENRKGFGLSGETSFEVTAAVSQSTLQKKAFVEARLKPEVREKFRNSQAREQKQIIEKMVDRRFQRTEAEKAAAAQAAAPRDPNRQMTRVSYIDIQDDGMAMVEPAAEPEVASARIKNLARAAWEAERESGLSQQPHRRNDPRKTPQRTTARTTAEPAPSRDRAAVEEMQRLQNEVVRLQKMVESFQEIPQTFQGSVHPGAEYGIGYDFSAIYQKLCDSGLSVDLSAELAIAASREIDPIQAKKKHVIEAWVAKWVLANTQIVEKPFEARVHTFSGPTGGGKTSQLIKIAAHLALRERKRIAIVTADTTKVGAAEQLKIYSQILNVPFALIRNASDWQWLEPQLTGVDVILVDMPSSTLSDATEISWLRSLLPVTTRVQSHLCLNVMMKEADALEAVRRYRVMQPTDLMFTAIDLSVQHGLIPSIQLKSGLPLHSFGIGPQIPEDFELASKEKVLDLIFKLSRTRK